jgi:hypothetical protein
MVNDLAYRIENYVNGSKSRSLCRLAKDSGVPYSTLRRITGKDVSSVGMETAVALLRVFEKSAEILAFVEKHFPTSGKMFKDFAAKLNSDSFAPKDLTDLLFDYSCWFFSVMAERYEGVAIGELEYHIGVEQARRAIKEFEECDLVEHKDNRYHLKDKDYILSGNARIQLEIIKHICDTYDENKKSDAGHMLVNLTKQWNDDGLKFVRETLRDAAMKINEASNDEKYKGSKTCMFGIVSSAMN